MWRHAIATAANTLGKYCVSCSHLVWEQKVQQELDQIPLHCRSLNPPCSRSLTAQFVFVFLCICICVVLHFQQELDRIPLHCRSLGAQYEKWCNGVDFCEAEHRAICSDGRFGWVGDQCHASTSSAFLYLCICIFVFVYLCTDAGLCCTSGIPKL